MYGAYLEYCICNICMENSLDILQVMLFLVWCCLRLVFYLRFDIGVYIVVFRNDSE